MKKFENAANHIVKFHSFRLTDRKLYKLSVSRFSTTDDDAMDCLSYHNDMPFTTFDKDNDMNITGNCAGDFSGGWWYNDCIMSKLNGINYGPNMMADFKKGIVWHSLTEYTESLESAEMAIRPIQ